MSSKSFKHLQKASPAFRQLVQTETEILENSNSNRRTYQPYMPSKTLTRKRFLSLYEPPLWAAGLKNIPKYKVQLGNTQTPIHKWDLPGSPDGVEVFIKRDDMIGADMTGNKTRRLEFLLADALAKECTSVITAGDVYSNHCRCTAIGARRLGMQPHLILISPTSTTNTNSFPCCGNALLYRMTGAQMYLAPANSKYISDIKPRVEQLVEILRHEWNEDAYPIHYGGSSSIGVFGCLESFDELIHQGVLDNFTDVVVTISSAGEAAGLAIGNYLTGSKLRIHGICHSCDKASTERKINRLIGELGVCRDHKIPRAEEITNVMDRKSLQCHVSSSVMQEFICNVATSTGIILDPTYTGKSAYNLVKLLQHNTGKFKGNRVLFIHTGGIFSLFNGHMDSVVRQSTSSNIHNWKNLEDNPFRELGEALASTS